MKKSHQLYFWLLIAAAVITMIIGHALILTSGKWFIPGLEKYNLHTRWVSDFAAVYPQGWYIKLAMLFFALAWTFCMLPHYYSAGGGFRGRAWWAWMVLLNLGVVFGLLLVMVYDMSPAQYYLKEPSWLGKVFLGKKPVLEQIPRQAHEYAQMWHHQVGFRLFLASGLLTMLTLIIYKRSRALPQPVSGDVLLFGLTLGCNVWLYWNMQSIAGIPQRALLVLIFIWICKQLVNSSKNLHQQNI